MISVQYQPIEVAEAMDKLFHRGYAFPVSDRLLVRATEKLNDLGILETSNQVRYACVNENDDDYYTLSGQALQCSGEIITEDKSGEIECSECGRLIKLQEKTGKEFIVIRAIDFEKICSRIMSQLKYKYEYSGAGEYIVDVDGNKVSLVVLHALQKHEALTHCLLPGKGKSLVISNLARPKGFLCHLSTGESILFPEKVNDELQRIGYSVEPRDLLSKLNLKRYLDQLQGKRDWQFYESTLVPYFLEKLKERHQEFTEYLNFLYSHRGDLLGCLIVHVGGAGKTDIMTIPKHEYISAAIEGNAIYDAKCYKDPLTSKQLYQVMGHQQLAPGAPQSAVIIGNVNKVTIWDELSSLWYSKGRWSVVVITQALFIEMICALDLEDEVSGLVKQYLASQTCDPMLAGQANM